MCSLRNWIMICAIYAVSFRFTDAASHHSNWDKGTYVSYTAVLDRGIGLLRELCSNIILINLTHSGSTIISEEESV